MQKISPVIIFFIVSLLIVISWYTTGITYGGAEMGVTPFYNPARSLNIQQYIWWTDVAPGVLIPQFITAVPLYFILSILQNLFSPLILQILLFFILLFLMGYGVYLFTLYLIGEEKRTYAVVGGLFYMLNSYMMVEVWHRFLYTGIILAATVPILALFWQKWLKEGRLIFLLVFLLINLVFSYIYGNLTSAIAVWALMSLLTIKEIILPWRGKKLFLITGYKFLIGVLLFLLTNLWWLIPVFRVSTQVLPEQHSSEDNIGTLVSISKQTIMPFILQYANPFYLFDTKELGQIYTNFIFLILPWVATTVIFIGIFTVLKRKHLASLALFYLLILLIAKGAAAPWGYTYIWGFMKIFFLGILRNPFEKLGILLPLFGSILFAVGLENLFLFSRRKFGNPAARFLVLAIFISVLTYAFPMFTGGIFSKPDYSLKVKVPLSYEQVDEWLKGQKDEIGNILHLPFSGGDVETYNWQNGYHGVEINDILFTALPSLTRNAGIKRVDDTLKSLTYIFVPPYSENKEQILRTLRKFNVKYIVLHKDVVWSDKNTYGEKTTLLNPVPLEDTLNSLNFLNREQQFGDLVIYKLADSVYRDIISVSETNEIVYPGETDIMQILSLTNFEQDIITPVSNLNGEFLSTQPITIFPDRSIEYREASDSAMLTEIKGVLGQQLPGIRDYFYSIGYLQSLELANDLISSTEKVLLMYQYALTSRLSPPLQQTTDYQSLMEKIFVEYRLNLSIHMLFKKYISNALKIHLWVLRKLDQNDTAKMVDNFMVKNELLPVYRNQSSTDINSQIFKFYVPQTGNYQLLVNSNLMNREIRINGEKVTAGKSLDIKEGNYEISLQSMDKEQINNIALKMKRLNEASSSGKISNIKKDSSVKYKGKIHLDKPSFVLFAQSFHPGWVLTLAQDGKPIEVRDHLIGNLYNNAWWINNQGDFDFQIEFKPQETVTTGIILSGLGWMGLLVAGSIKLRRK